MMLGEGTKLHRAQGAYMLANEILNLPAMLREVIDHEAAEAKKQKGWDGENPEFEPVFER